MVDRISSVSLALRYGAAFFPSLLALQWLAALVLGIPFPSSLGVIVSATWAYSFGIIGLGAAAVAAEEGAISYRVPSRPEDQANLLARSVRFWSAGPFRPLFRPHRDYGTMFFLAYFLTPYWLLWMFADRLGLPSGLLGLKIGAPYWVKTFIWLLGIAPILAAVVASIIVLPRRES